MSARLTDEDRRLRAVTEAAWQQQVLDVARWYGWLTYAPPRAGVRGLGTVRTTTPGYPDLTLVRGPRLIFAELKRQTGRTTPEQDAWHDALRRASVEVYLWRPADLPLVEQTLAHPTDDRRPW